MSARRKTVIDGILYFVNIIVALALACSYLAYYVPPSVASFFSFMALAYPVWFFANLLFAIYWLIRFKLKIILPLLVMGIGYKHIQRFYQFGAPHQVVEENNRLKVMSFNVRLFNQYNWIEDENVGEKIRSLIAEENPDILLLQEYRDDWKEKAENFGFKYQHFKVSKWGRYGSVIFSKFPIKGSQTVLVEGDSSANNEFHFIDISWKDKPLRVINLHLASVGLENADYELLQNPGKEDQEKIEKGLRSIAGNLDKAFKRRELQIKRVVEEIKDSPSPKVLCGDFNDVPQSFVYHQIAADLKDSFMEGGHGFGKTYVKSPVPLRIDYIFHSPELRAFNFRVIKQELSDHYPVIAELQWQ